ncbi:MAG: hypothetical protein V2I48_06865 [Xanthomonadales bacterium]|jgi:hypothetical protein|nr:hypothetical protein [Xanthomonadales bacterium]
MAGKADSSKPALFALFANTGNSTDPENGMRKASLQAEQDLRQRCALTAERFSHLTSRTKHG